MSKIAIDANEGFRRNLTGIGIYARHLVRELSGLDISDELTFLAIRSSGTDYGIVSNDRLKLLRSPGYRTFWSQIRLPVHLLGKKYDLFHSLDHKLPRFCRCKKVVTVYDLGFIKFPETVERAHRERFVWFTRDAVRRADRVIAISEATKQDVCEIFGITPDKIDVVHLGVDGQIYKAGIEPALNSVRYILSVGTLQPRKNYAMLIRAFKRMCARLREPVELLIVGKRGWMWEEIEKLGRESPFAERIRFLGYVPDAEMARLYSGAMMVAMPSLYEGFGIPLLEAMACGVPVISANRSSLPEVVGEAGVLLDPSDENAWEETMIKYLEDEPGRKLLGQKGILRAQSFSWERTAKETMRVYLKTISRKL